MEETLKNKWMIIAPLCLRIAERREEMIKMGN